MPKLDVKKITRPVIAITDWGDLLTLNTYDHHEFNSWLEFVYTLTDIGKIKDTYDVIYKIIKENFIDNMKSNEDLYLLICEKLHKNSSDYIYRLIIAKMLGKSLLDKYSAIKQDESFLTMLPIFKAEIEFAFDYLNQ